MESIATSLMQFSNNTPPPDGWFFYALTICLFVAVCLIVYGVFKWLVNYMKESEVRKEEYFRSISEAITDLRIIVKAHETEIEHIKDKVFPIKYPKKGQ